LGIFCESPQRIWVQLFNSSAIHQLAWCERDDLTRPYKTLQDLTKPYKTFCAAVKERERQRESQEATRRQSRGKPSGGSQEAPEDPQEATRQHSGKEALMRLSGSQLCSGGAREALEKQF